MITCIVILTNERIVTGSTDSRITIWNLKNEKYNKTLIGHSKGIQCMSLLSDSSYRIVSGSVDCTLKIWNTSDFNFSDECDAILTGHTDSVNCVCALHDGRIVSGSYGPIDGTLRIWDVQTKECNIIIRSSFIRCINVLPDGRIISGSIGNTLYVWNQWTGALDVSLFSSSGKFYRPFNLDCVNFIIVLSNGQIVTSNVENNTLLLWS
jgi:WD40 repeat protein